VNRKGSLLAVALTAVAAASIAPAVAAAPSVAAEVVEGVLRISGGGAADKITLGLSGDDQGQLEIDFGDDGVGDFTFALAAFNVIDVRAGNGDDTVRIDQANGVFTTTKATRISGENGDDVLIGGGGAEVFSGGNGDDLVDGNQGADTAFLDRGDDTFVWDQGDGSDIVDGGRGIDTLIFNGFGANEAMAATASNGRVLFTRVQGNIVMSLDDVEAIDVRPLGGTDTVTVNDLTGTDVKRVDVDLAAVLGGSTADGQADTVAVVGTIRDDAISADSNGAAVEVTGLAAFVRVTHADAALDSLVIDGRAGDDAVSVDSALERLIQVFVQ
jgi:hypothetical protein